eukprot:scaffold228742_cov15-Tisochrysis_lutea.AAC.1
MAATDPQTDSAGAAIKLLCSIPRPSEVPVSIAISLLNPQVLFLRRFLQVRVFAWMHEFVAASVLRRGGTVAWPGCCLGLPAPQLWHHALQFCAPKEVVLGPARSLLRGKLFTSVGCSARDGYLRGSSAGNFELKPRPLALAFLTVARAAGCGKTRVVFDW